MPLTGSPYSMWYNADWFGRKGISTKRENFPTWDELRKLSKEFTQWKGGKLVAAGYVPFGSIAKSGGNLTATLFAWSALNGGQIYMRTQEVHYQLRCQHRHVRVHGLLAQRGVQG